MNRKASRRPSESSWGNDFLTLKNQAGKGREREGEIQMKKATKLLCLLLTFVMAIAMLAGCGGNDTQQNSGDDKQQLSSGSGDRDSIVIATANEPPMLHPYDHNATAANYMNGLTFSTLFRSNVDTLEPEPNLVESYEIMI